MSRIFVFGSNLAGRHGKGSALTARNEYGAVYGVGTGPTGGAYAIPTKDRDLNPLPLEVIGTYVNEFLAYARAKPELQFEVTKIGCGLAGYTEDEISPMFADAPENCHLPDGWRPRAELVYPRILIFGGRDFGSDSKPQVEQFVRAWTRLVDKYGFNFEVVNGGCKTGADRLARLCAALGEIACITEPARWSDEGKPAGPLRNQRMIDKWQPKAAVAFPGGGGTADMTRRLRKAGVPVWIPYGGVNA